MWRTIRRPLSESMRGPHILLNVFRSNTATYQYLHITGPWFSDRAYAPLKRKCAYILRFFFLIIYEVSKLRLWTTDTCPCRFRRHKQLVRKKSTRKDGRETRQRRTGKRSLSDRCITCIYSWSASAFNRDTPIGEDCRHEKGKKKKKKRFSYYYRSVMNILFSPLCAAKVRRHLDPQIR